MATQAPQQLHQFPHVGIFPQFCAQQQTTLILKEKVLSLSGDTFSVKDGAGRVVVQCQGKTFSISDRKEFTDAAGKPLFSLRTKHLHIHKTFEAEDPSGKVLFTVKGKFTLMGSKMVATFRNVQDGRDVELLVKGDFFDRKATITMNDQVVTQVGRNFLNVREIFGGQQSYQVSVAPGVDLALMAAVCICLDEKENEK